MVDNCQLCGGIVLELGILGNLMHLQCRSCGAMFSQKPTFYGTADGVVNEVADSAGFAQQGVSA